MRETLRVHLLILLHAPAPPCGSSAFPGLNPAPLSDDREVKQAVPDLQGEQS